MPSSSHVLAIHARTEAPDRPVLSLTGAIDLSTAPHLRDQIVAAAADDATCVVIDLTNVEFMDSPGLGILVHCHRLLTEQATDLVLRAPRGDVLALLDMAGLTAHLNIER